MGEVIKNGPVNGKVATQLKRIIAQAERHPGVIIPDIVLQTDCSFRLSPRNFAAVMVGRPRGSTAVIGVCENFSDQPLTRIRGILWHEIGHILDDIHGKRKWRKRTKIRGADDEQWADLAVAIMCKTRIYYDNDLVQRAGPGARGYWPRPKGLR